VKVRDAYQMLTDTTDEYITSLAPNEVRKHIDEKAFIALKFEEQKGAKLGTFEIANQNSNTVNAWKTPFDELGKANATIKDRYHGKNYEYSYWLYGEGKIYRQKLKRDCEQPCPSS